MRSPRRIIDRKLVIALASSLGVVALTVVFAIFFSPQASGQLVGPSCSGVNTNRVSTGTHCYCFDNYAQSVNPVCTGRVVYCPPVFNSYQQIVNNCGYDLFVGTSANEQSSFFNHLPSCVSTQACPTSPASNTTPNPSTPSVPVGRGMVR